MDDKANYAFTVYLVNGGKMKVTANYLGMKKNDRLIYLSSDGKTTHVFPAEHVRAVVRDDKTELVPGQQGAGSGASRVE